MEKAGPVNLLVLQTTQPELWLRTSCANESAEGEGISTTRTRAGEMRLAKKEAGRRKQQGAVRRGQERAGSKEGQGTREHGTWT